MDNTDLFKFDFVDRYRQTSIVNSVINGADESNIILLYGCHGVGKSYFLNYILEHVQCNDAVYVELKAEDTSQSCLYKLLEEIQRLAQRSFVEFFNDNYEATLNIAKKIGQLSIEKIFHVDLKLLIDTLYDVSMLYMTKTKEQQNSLKIICTYIDNIIKNRNKILIIIDNFSLCDNKSLNILLDIFTEYYKHTKVFFIISTTDETLNKRHRVSRLLLERLPLIPIEIEPFDNSEYFFTILYKIFDLNSRDKDLIEKIFNFCRGYPQELRNFIHELHDRNGIYFSSKDKKAIIKEDVVNDIILSNSTKIQFGNLPLKHKVILYVVVNMGKVLSFKLLAEIAYYLIEDMFKFSHITMEEIYNSIYELYTNDTISIFNIRFEQYIKMEHDIKFENLKQQFKDDPFKPRVNYSLYNYTITHKNQLKASGFSDDDIQFLEALHSYLAEVTNWQRINYNYGKRKYALKQYDEAQDVFNRLRPYWGLLNCSEKLVLSSCYYECGDYSTAEAVLENIDINASNIHQDILIDIYILRAKIERILLNNTEAMDNINKLMKLCSQEDVRYVRTCIMKQRILTNMEGNRHQAQIAFEDAKDLIPDKFKSSLDYADFLQSSIEYYRGKQAQDDLNVSEEIILLHDDQPRLGCLYLNKGFDLFWQGHIDEALDLFKKSKNLIKNTMIHEISYPLNNMASCYLLDDKIEEAISCLYSALLWNRSLYAEIVLKTQLMVCLALKKDNQFESLATELSEFIIKGKNLDISMQIKVNYNIGFAYSCMNKTIDATYYYNRAYTITKQYDRNTLPLLWIKDFDPQIEKDIQRRISPQYYLFIQNRFEPWLLSLDHF